MGKEEMARERLCCASINSLTNFFTLYVVPMFFFSGVFYPVDGPPKAIQRMAWILPLTWATELMRSLAYGEIYAHTFLSLAILIAFTVVFIPLSIRGMRRRLNQVAGPWLILAGRSAGGHCCQVKLLKSAQPYYAAQITAPLASNSEWHSD